MRYKLFILVCLIFSFCAAGAQPIQKVRLLENSTLSLTDTSKQGAIVAFLEGYLNEVLCKPPSRYYSYWEGRSHSRWPFPDYPLWHIEYDKMARDSIVVRPILLAAQEVCEDTFEAKIAFVHSKADRPSPDIRSIYNFIVALSPRPRLLPPVDYYTREWKHSDTDGIAFVYPETHQFNEVKARQCIAFNDSIARFFGDTAIRFTYYISPDMNTMYRINGFDYQSLMFLRNQYGGFADLANSKVFAGNDSEHYPHELVHLYSYRRFGGHISRFYDEGFATYLGGSVGRDFRWHVKKLARYLDHNNLNLDEWIRRPVGEANLDDETNVHYALGALLCDVVVQRNGMDGLFLFLGNTGVNGEIWQYTADYLGLELSDLGGFLREEVCKY